MTKIALITGASSGIGAAIAIQLAKEGQYSLALVARRKAKLEHVAQMCLKEGAKEVHILQKDLSNLDDCKTVIEETVEHYKGLDVLISNAGISKPCALIPDRTVKEAQEVMHLNYLVPFALTQSALPHLVKSRGCILYVGSVLGIMPAAKMVDYCSSKAALHAMAKCVAQEYLTKGVRINVVAPGAIATDLLGDIMTVPNDQILDDFGSLCVPIGRLGKCEEIADLAAYLVSDKNRFMTGSVIVSDGGQCVDKLEGEYKVGLARDKLLKERADHK
ncbi:hypothetical protein TCAL_13893 [Tigriopus californicus]|uniref:Uncharacterized protein n=1 Tax=Tigriopus californicus TaxID=6832 RepID=A0A553PCF6_TIGCA|nr:3-oxoacyl-[acyl-carrier-protein] reductase FabG-like [Tigriopus californicus]TRY75348.1 hypothetical protein TCAL_13893 [Tigriopus californicus]|eukprot:TCALIF_13893-PA protein Name:"Similar to fabG 3-oxoacyl-[acyl-carrier-protein] reductase FabG (Staphylococcus aureus (strain MW2))" AED:0.11 eAED:0.11 QI:107/1/1/1/1/1/4/40/274